MKEKRDALVHECIQHPDTKYLKLKYCVKQQFRNIERIDDKEYLPLGLYNKGRGAFRKESTKGKDLGDSTFFFIKEGDLILSGQFAWEGAVTIANKLDDGCVVSHRYPVVTGLDNVLSTQYLWAFLTTALGDFLLNDCSRGAAGRNRPLNMNLLLNEKIPLPPIEEQMRVVEIVNRENQLREAIIASETFIVEHKTSLIISAITGQIDVRNYKDEVE